MIKLSQKWGVEKNIPPLIFLTGNLISGREAFSVKHLSMGNILVSKRLHVSVGLNGFIEGSVLLWTVLGHRGTSKQSPAQSLQLVLFFL